MEYRVIERIKCSIMGWFDHIERIPEKEMTQRLHMSVVVDVLGAR